MKIKRGSTSVRRLIFVADSSSTTGAGLANLAHNASGLVGYYFAGDLNNEAQITLASATLGSFTSGGWVAVDNTNMPGWYEVGIPDAALDGGNEVAIQYRGATNMVPVNIYIELDAVDYQTDAFGALKPTTAGRTLDVSTGGEAGIDFANIGSPTTTVNLSGTTIKTATDVETDTQDIQSRLPSALVSGRMDSSVGAMAANVITATSIAADAITDAKVASDVTIASVTGAVGSVTGNVGGNVVGSVGSVTAQVTANVTSISGDSTAADNCEAFFDGTGYAGTNNVIPTVTSVTNRVTANTDQWNGTGVTTAIVRADLINIAGSAVSTSTAQLGVNVVNAAGTAWGSGAITANSIATGAITNAKFAAGAIDAAAMNVDGSEFTAIPWNAAWDAEVQSEVQDAIEANHLDHLLAATYDPASKPGVSDALLNELVENDGGVARFTANALEQAPSGGGGVADWTSDERTAIRAILGIPGSGTTPTDPTTGILDTIRDLVVTVDTVVDAVEVDTQDIQSRLPAALVSGRIDASVGAMAANTITASALASDAVDEIALQSAQEVFDFTVEGIDSFSQISAQTYDTTSRIEADTQNIQSRLPAALIAGRIDASVGAMAANTITAAALASDAVAEIADAVWDEPFADHTTNTTFGFRIDAAITTRASQTSLDTVEDFVDTEVAAIKTTTDKLDSAMELDGAVYRFTANALEEGPSGGGGVADWTSDERTAIRSILGIPGSGTTPTDPTSGILDTIRDLVVTVDTVVDAVEVDTQDIQSRLPTALVSGRIDASVGAMAADTISAAALASDAVAEIADAVWDESYNQHTTAGSFGKLMDTIRKSNTVIDGTVTATVSPTTTSFSSNVNYPTGAFKHSVLLFLSGPLAEQNSPILTYVNTNGVITVEEAFTSVPQTGNEFIIIPTTHVHAIAAIQAGLATTTQLTTVEGKIDTIDDFVDTEVAAILAAVDTEVAAIKAKTDNLPSDPADASDIAASFARIEGAGFSTATDTLEKIRDAVGSGGGGGGASVNILPASVYAPKRGSETILEIYIGETIQQSLTVYQSDGTTPLSLAGKTLEVVFDKFDGTDVIVVSNSSITVSGANNNVATFAYPSAATESIGTRFWALRDASAPKTVYAFGQLKVLQTAFNDP